MFVLILYLYILRQCILILVRVCMMRNRDFVFTQIYLAFHYSYCLNQRDAADFILQYTTNVIIIRSEILYAIDHESITLKKEVLNIGQFHVLFPVKNMYYLKCLFLCSCSKDFPNTYSLCVFA